MVLRDIYAEICDIFDFEYEKNRNGTCRVNTVIKNLVYPKLYESENYKEQQLAYFLKYSDYSYTNYPNIKNSFTDLMNPRDNVTRYPVEELAQDMSIEEMYTYYEELIGGLSDSKRISLDSFIHRIFEDDTVLHSKLKLVCNKSNEFLVWIILSSMFNTGIFENKYHDYIKSHQEVSQDISISEDAIFHKISIMLGKKTIQVNTLNIFFLIFIGIQIILAFAPYVLKPVFSDMNTYKLNRYYLFVQLYYLFIIFFWTWHAKFTFKLMNLKIIFKFKEDFKDLFNNISTEDFSYKNFKVPPIKPSSAPQKRRSNIRMLCTAITLLLCILSIIPSVIFNSFPLLFALGATWIVIDLYIDRKINDYTIRCNYDSMELDANTKPRPYRGLAKIYHWEYKKTKLNLKDSYYHNDIPIHSTDCYMNIFAMAYDRIRWSLQIRYMIVIYLNVILTFLVTMNHFFSKQISYFHFPEKTDINLFVMFYLLATGIFFAIATLTNGGYFHDISTIAQNIYHIQSNPEDAEKLFLDLQSDNIIRDIDQARGIFVYDIGRFAEGTLVDNIYPESDRMLFFHRTISLRSSASTIFGFIYAILLIMIVWHMQLYFMFIPITVGILAIYFFITKYVTGRYHKKKILKEIQRL